jgi:hypothetical protein
VHQESTAETCHVPAAIAFSSSYVPRMKTESRVFLSPTLQRPVGQKKKRMNLRLLPFSSARRLETLYLNNHVRTAALKAMRNKPPSQEDELANVYKKLFIASIACSLSPYL